jgi:hypothetical protein
MPHSGRRYRLIIYTASLDRWRKFILGLGLTLIGLAVGLWILSALVPQYLFLLEPDLTLWAVAGAGGFTVLLSVFVLWMSKSAYVEACPNQLRLVTPFLKLNISYQLIIQASVDEMKHLFPIQSYKGWRLRLARQLAVNTAIVLDLRRWPIPYRVLAQFLSPFFFPDKSPLLALLVSNWMEFSMELDSLRSAWIKSQLVPNNDPHSVLLARLSDFGK